jgi:hypothetical protein
MLLRRFLTHFKTQNWTAIIVEFLIVVVGIFVGLQVDQWNQERKERVLESQYVLSIKRDLQADIAELDRTIELARKRAQSGRLLITSLNENRIDSNPTEFVWAVYNSLWLNYPSYTRTTVDELSSTGNLRIIRDESLKSSLAEYYAMVYRHEQFTVNWRDMQIALEHTFPAIMDFATREAGILRYSGGPEWINKEFDFNQDDAEAILKSIVEHPVAKGQIENMVRIQDSHYMNLVGIRNQAIRIEGTL